MSKTNVITVQLRNVDTENMHEVAMFSLFGSEFSTIFNVLPTPEHYGEDVEALEQAKEGGATGVLWKVNDDTFEDEFFAAFQTETEANKFAKEIESTVQTFSYTDDDDENGDLFPIDDVITVLESWEQRPKDMTGETVVFVGRNFAIASKKEMKAIAGRIGANVVDRIMPDVDYAVFSNRHYNMDDKLEKVQEIGAMILNEKQWCQILCDNGIKGIEPWEIW